jgi:hypothetical protein
MNENGTRRPAGTIPGLGGEGIKEDDRGVNSTTIYCKHLRECHNVPQYNGNLKRNKIKIFKKVKKCAWVREGWLAGGRVDKKEQQRIKW